MDTLIQQHIIRRAKELCKTLAPVLPDGPCDFYMAGGCLTGKVRDIDLFPGKTAVPTPNSSQIIKTKNATTYKGPTCPIQVCRYQHGSLKELVESFDFAHIQVGVLVYGVAGTLTVNACYFTEAFVQSRALGVSWFTGSQYPLASLIRAAKYAKRGDMPQGSYIRSVIDSLAAIVERGFDGYKDFKDQLDAVDLGLVPEELDEVSQAGLMGLFKKLDTGLRPED